MRKKLLLPLALKVAASAMGQDVSALLTDVLVESIALVEGNDPNKIGAHGERGWWQMRQCAVDDVNRWRKACGLDDTSFEEVYGDRNIQRDYALQYLCILQERYRREFGCEPTEKILIGMWNAGKKATKKTRCRNWRMPREVFEYARRVLNMRDKILAEQQSERDAKTEAGLRERGRRLMTQR